jgi:enamine deaminase RidA (YjgF/YER057c/UK114 family)
MSRHLEPVNPPSLARPVGFSHGYLARGGTVLFLAGQVAVDGEGRVVGRGDLVAQFRQVCINLRAVLEAAGGGLTDIASLTIYVLDVAAYRASRKAIGEVYREFFGKHFPAMTLVGARDLFDAPDGCAIEIQGVAVLP